MSENVDTDLQKEEIELLQKLAINREKQREKNLVEFYKKYPYPDGYKIKYEENSTKKMLYGQIEKVVFVGVNPWTFRVRLFNVHGQPSKMLREVYPEKIRPAD
jgi:hypothetical protein